MKSSTLLSGIAAVVFFSGFGLLAQAGTLTIENGPSFVPDGAFTDNDIQAELSHNPNGIMGDVVRLFGDSLVAPAEESPRILIGGDFEANAGDLFTVIYDFTVNLNTSEPITVTLGAQTVVQGVMETFNTLITINPGVDHYQGQVTGPMFDLATSGVWKGHVYFNLPSQGAGSTDNADPGSLLVHLKAVDFQLASVPEPSTYALLGVGLVAVALFARRRRLA